ncbi:AAA family ATPase [Promicromonospora sukumoe]|uniref:AAA family ATPase n=1 Tax=Promicromonospora sukumoe TaxID=88382 RepID=UPI00037F1630|nr:ATP-binding protein [Promicromonospora sukumoe]
MRTPATPARQLFGREPEARRLAELTAAAREGRGGALVLRGEAGIGKTTLLDHVEGAAAGHRVVRVSGAQLEADLPFAALHQLCLPLLDHLADLPAPHCEALSGAFGLADAAPGVLQVGLAALGLLAAAARERPLVCLVDDAQWLDADSAGVIAFLARRVSAEPVAIVLGVRLPDEATALDGLPDLVVGPLGDPDARALLAAQTHEVLDEQVRDRLLTEARGNPLALLALPRAGGFAQPDAASAPNRVERGFAAVLARLPDDARTLLTIAAADPTGDPALLWPAAEAAGLDLEATGAAASATGLIEFGTRIRFLHPLARAVAYQTAGLPERRLAHRLLADVTDPVTDPDRHAWHGAQAAAVPDDDLATALEDSASRAQARGGAAAAAAFLERAAELTPDHGRRTARTLAAVRAQLDAGAADRASGLLTAADGTIVDELGRAEADLLRGRIAFVRTGDGDGPAHMLRAAARLATIDPERSRASYLEALEMSLLVGRATGMMDRVLREAHASSTPAR